MKHEPAPFAVQFEEARKDKVRVEKRWDLCRMFLGGYQNVEYDRRKQQLRLVDEEADERYTDNQIKPLYKAIVSGLAVEYPSMSVLPASPSTEDILKARTSLEASRYYWSAVRFKNLFREGVEWIASTGNAAFHTFHDPADKEVRTEIVSPYDLFFNKGATDKPPRWTTRRHLVDRTKAADTYGSHADHLWQRPEYQSQGSLLLDDVVPADMIELFEVYWDDGRHEIRTLDVVLDEDEYNPKTNPLRHIWYVRVPGTRWGDGLVFDLIDDQIVLNRKHRQIITAVENQADPYTMVPTGSHIPVDAFHRGGDKVIRFSAAAGSPFYLVGNVIAPEAFADIQRVKAGMLDKAGIHSTSLGKTARGVNSAKHTEELKEGDRSQLQPVMAVLEDATVDVAETALVLMQTHYTEAKWVRMLDDQGRFISRQLDFTQIVDEPEVLLEAGSLFRHETADRRQKTIELHQAGLIDADTAMAELAFGTSNKFVLDKIKQMAHAQDLLEGAKAGFDIQIFPTDDIPAIRRVFEEFMQDEEFYSLPPDFQQHIANTYLQTLDASGVPTGGKIKLAEEAAPPKPAGRGGGGGPAQVPGTPIGQLPPAQQPPEQQQPGVPGGVA